MDVAIVNTTWVGIVQQVRMVVETLITVSYMCGILDRASNKLLLNLHGDRSLAILYSQNQTISINTGSSRSRARTQTLIDTTRAYNRACTRMPTPSIDFFVLSFNSSSPASQITRISRSASAICCLNLFVDVSEDVNLDSTQNLMRWGAMRSVREQSMSLVYW